MNTNITEKLKNFDNLITEKMKDWCIPGIAFGIVKDGEVVHVGELGLRDIKNNSRVTKDTIFAIGSTSKAFTSMAVGILVEEGKLDWDTPVKNYIPDFGMYDNYAGERLTVRDMLCHRTGIPRHELMWYNSSISRKEVVNRLKYLEPNKDFRTTWQYNNHMYASVGYLIEAISGMTWEDFVQTKIFAPLGMNNSNFSVEKSKQLPDYSFPYAQQGESAVEIPFRSVDAMGPAGSINSNITDMLKWLMLHLNKGKYNGKQIISEANILQMHLQHIPCQVNPWTFEEIQASAYGLGWFVEVYRGKKLVNHAGNVDGFTALVSFLPDENTGIVILSNLHNNFLTYAISYYLYDIILGNEFIDWSGRQKEGMDKFVKIMMEMNKEKTKKDDTKAINSRPSKEYAGLYENPGYGQINIIDDNGILKMMYNNFEFILDYKGDDAYSFEYKLLGIAFPAVFKKDGKGCIESLSIPFEPSVKDIVFKMVRHKG